MVWCTKQTYRGAYGDKFLHRAGFFNSCREEKDQIPSPVISKQKMRTGIRHTTLALGRSMIGDMPRRVRFRCDVGTSLERYHQDLPVAYRSLENGLLLRIDRPILNTKRIKWIGSVCWPGKVWKSRMRSPSVQKMSFVKWQERWASPKLQRTPTHQIHGVDISRVLGSSLPQRVAPLQVISNETPSTAAYLRMKWGPANGRHPI